MVKPNPPFGRQQPPAVSVEMFVDPAAYIKNRKLKF